MKYYKDLSKLYDKANIQPGILITDADEIKEYEKRLKEKIDLPEDIYHKSDHQEGDYSNVFYKVIDDDFFLKRQIELQNVIQQKRIANVLTFFMWLTIISIVISAIYILAN